ncbi:MAG: phosphoribosylamine--glycine ligase [Anaerolineae bacterium]|nr:phosphoribosylamine--glycine ligase [Anaerolineae bacterium]
MHVLVVGGGGREHALAWKLTQSPHIDWISVTPGNAGTRAIAQNVDIDATDVVSLLEFADSEGVNLVVVGPEDPLESGLVDQFEAAGIPTFGPRRQAAMVESSKSYAKRLMNQYGVPTAPYELFTDLPTALDYVSSQRAEEIVIKADGLARGKGVFLPRGASDAEGILHSLLIQDVLGRAGRCVIIEERLIGDEISVMAFTDGEHLALMPPVRDHKRLYDRDIGPNTGGMGSYAPAPMLTPELTQQVRHEIIEPILHGLQAENCDFKGVIYAGVTLTQNGPMALEINTRLGDPGAQVVLPLLETDLLEVIDACLNGSINDLSLRWSDQTAVSVVLASAGYPERSDPGLPITQTPVMPEGVYLFHAGTRLAEDGTLVTTGGRVMDVTAVGPDLRTAMTRAYEAVRRVHFEGVHYRHDIGARALWR